MKHSLETLTDIEQLIWISLFYLKLFCVNSFYHYSFDTLSHINYSSNKNKILQSFCLENAHCSGVLFHHCVQIVN